MKQDWLEATQSGDCKQVQDLLDQGADINALDKHSQTALMNAALRGDHHIVAQLVSHDANLDHTAKYKLTALMLAVINNHKEVVEILVQSGADTSLQGSYGSFAKTPLEYARDAGFTDIVRILENAS
ncbi:MAG: hypothetical protein C0615_11645 [Desulfuromonas sp.]|nr:MAG: hypothetical protein C0615_11645 [Desulfuromonas sp.]